MKEMGFPIKYCRDPGYYYYEENGKMVDHFFLRDMPDRELRKINGGKNYFQFFSKSENTGMWHNNFVK